MNKQTSSRRHFIAIVTGGISVLIGIIYLLMIFLLDLRGPMIPPPQEAMNVVGVFFVDSFQVVQQLVLRPFQ